MKELNASKTVVAKILGDLDFLRSIPYEFVFKKLWVDAKKSWRSVSLDFTTYFEREYMESKRFRWNYLYIKGAIPNTDNALEGLNRSLKYNSTCRVSLAFPNFLKFIVKEVEFRSRRSSFFVKRPVIKEVLWNEAESLKEFAYEDETDSNG